MPDAGPKLPPRICKAPGATAMPWFADATAEVGLAATADLEPQAVSVIAADLDGDGWVDLLAQRGESARGPVSGKRARFVLMSPSSMSTNASSCKRPTQKSRCAALRFTWRS